MCDAEYVGYTSRHLLQRIDEHRYSAIGKHLKNDHGLETIGDLTNNFSVLKTGLSDLWNVFHKEDKAMLEHKITFHTRKTLYWILSLFYRHFLHMKI